MYKNKQLITFFIVALISIILFQTKMFSSESTVSMNIQDINELENYEREILEKLTNRNLGKTIGHRASISFSVYGGGGMIMPIGGEIKNGLKVGFIFDLGVYISFRKLKNLYLLLSGSFITMTALSRNTIIIGTETYLQENADGNFRMIPLLLGALYRFKITRSLYISPGFSAGISFNKIKLPTRINSDGSIGYTASSNDLAMRAFLKIHYFFKGGFQLNAFVDFFYIKEPSLSGSFLSFGVHCGYRF